MPTSPLDLISLYISSLFTDTLGRLQRIERVNTADPNIDSVPTECEKKKGKSGKNRNKGKGRKGGRNLVK